jgi:hypothetical protein
MNPRRSHQRCCGRTDHLTFEYGAYAAEETQERTMRLLMLRTRLPLEYREDAAEIE